MPDSEARDSDGLQIFLDGDIVTLRFFHKLIFITLFFNADVHKSFRMTLKCMSAGTFDFKIALNMRCG